MRRWTLITVAIVALAAAGCSGSASQGDPEVVEVSTTSMAFSLKEMTLDKGQPYKVVLTNSDSLLHDFSIDKIPAKVKAEHGDKHDMGGKKPDLHVSADAGKSGSVEFTPTKEGTYTFYCAVPGHKEAGMSGSLVIR